MFQDHERLLAHYAETRDSEAFREIVMGHKDMVYAACKRILRNAADAEDVTQNCFLALARDPGKVKGSVAGWLHRVAAGKSVDLIRQESARRAREATTMASSASDESAAWEGVSHALDEAINSLPEDLRIPVIRCYLEGHRQEDAAREMGVSQSAVAKRLQRGVETLRAALRKGGWMGSVALLATLLASRTSEAAPAALTASLGRLAIAGTTGASAGTAGGIGLTGGIGAMKLSILAAGIAAVIAIGIGVGVARSRPNAVPVENAAPQVAQKPPTDANVASTDKVEGPVGHAAGPAGAESQTPPEGGTQTTATSALAQEQVPPDSAKTAANDMGGQMSPAETFLRQSIDAVFKQGDPQALATYFHPDAERKNQGNGSAIRTLQGTPKEVLNEITIKEMIFFSAKDLPELARKYPDDMWAADRVPSRLKDASGACLAVFSMPDRFKRPEGGLWVCVAQKFGDEYKIVYWDDN